MPEDVCKCPSYYMIFFGLYLDPQTIEVPVAGLLQHLRATYEKLRKSSFVQLETVSGNNYPLIRYSFSFLESRQLKLLNISQDSANHIILPNVVTLFVTQSQTLKAGFLFALNLHSMIIML